MVSRLRFPFFLKAEAIFLLFDGSKEKILPQQTELYQFSYLKEKRLMTDWDRRFPRKT